MRYFLARNWTVFWNVSGFGPADLAVMKCQGRGPPLTLFVDVKLVSQRSYSGISLEQKYAGVRVLKVDRDGNCTLVPKGEELVKLSRTERKERAENEQDK